MGLARRIAIYLPFNCWYVGKETENTINERNARKRVEKGEKKVFFSNDKMNFINYFTLLMN